MVYLAGLKSFETKWQLRHITTKQTNITMKTMVISTSRDGKKQQIVEHHDLGVKNRKGKPAVRSVTKHIKVKNS